jgi:hypothetical protein
MTKEQFKKAMQSYMDAEDRLNIFNTLLRNIGNQSFIDFSYILEPVLQSIELTAGDDGGWISYWLYDLKRGAEAKKDTVRLGNSSVPCKTLDDLYDLIKGNA